MDAFGGGGPEADWLEEGTGTNTLLLEAGVAARWGRLVPGPGIADFARREWRGDTAPGAEAKAAGAC